MPTIKTRVVKKRKGARKAVGKTCKCCVCQRSKAKTIKKKRKATPVKKKAVKKKATSRKKSSRSGLNGVDGPTIGLSRLQRRLLSPAMQRAILARRNRRLKKTVL